MKARLLSLVLVLSISSHVPLALAYQTGRFYLPGEPIAGQAAVYQPDHSTAAGPTLAIPANIPAHVNEIVLVPVTFISNSHPIASTTFSIDLDQDCLAFDPADGDQDGTPDAITFNAPGAFSASVTFDAGDTDGELDFFIADTFPPLASLPDGVLATVTLTTTCQPAAGANITAPVSFSTDPAASFGNTSGQSVAGTALGGSVRILSEGPALSIPSGIQAHAGQAIPVPIRFVSNSHSIASTIFSVDLDQACLALDTADSNLDSIPDAVVLNTPGAFSASVTFDASDADGELDFFIADTFPPLSSLPDGILATITFTATCPAITSSITAPVDFSAEPTASFGNTAGQSVPGATLDGSVEIWPGAFITGIALVNDSPTIWGQFTTLTATAAGAGDTMSFTLSFGDSSSPFVSGETISGGVSISHSYPAVGVYLATVTTSNGINTVTATSLVTITNQPPLVPYDPTPPDKATNVPLAQTLSWHGGDPDGHAVTYMLAFGEVNPPPVVTTSLTMPAFDPGMLSPDTTYYWIVTTTDGISTSIGPTWRLTTFTPGVVLTPDHSDSVLPGSVAVYTHTLTNTGSGPDTFDLLTSSAPAGWLANVYPSSVFLGPGDATQIQLVVAAPAGAIGGTSVAITITVHGRGGSMASVTDLLAVLAQRSAPDLDPSIQWQTHLPGATAQFTHSLVNTGNAPDTFTVAVTPAWSASVEPSLLSLAAYSSGLVTVTVQVPAQALSGTMQVVTVTATSQSDPAVTASVLDIVTVRHNSCKIYLPLVFKNH